MRVLQITVAVLALFALTIFGILLKPFRSETYSLCLANSDVGRQAVLFVDSDEQEDLQRVQSVFPDAQFCQRERDDRDSKIIQVGVFNSPQAGQKALETLLQLGVEDKQAYLDLGK